MLYTDDKAGQGQRSSDSGTDKLSTSSWIGKASGMVWIVTAIGSADYGSGVKRTSHLPDKNITTHCVCRALMVLA